MKWSQVRLDSVAHINPKAKLTGSEPANMPVSFVPMAAVSDTTYSIEKEEKRELGEVMKGYTSFQQGDVLIAKITPCFENGKLAIANVRHQLGYGSTEFHVIRAFPTKIDSRYIYHYLRQEKIRFAGAKRMTGSAGQRRVPSNFLKELEIPLPPLAEQQRIAAILDKADALRAKRRTALAKLDTLLQSTFLHLFGDPVTNPMGWEVTKLGDMSSEVRYGTSVKCYDEPRKDDLPILRIPNVIDGEVELGDLKYAVLSTNEEEKLKMQPGDLLFVRSNGNPEYIGRCAVFNKQINAAYASYLIRVRFKKHSTLKADFVQQVVSFPSYRSFLVKEARTTAGNFNISASRLKTLPIVSPPESEQVVFLNFLTKLKLTRQRMFEEMKLFDNLFNSLQQRAFKGQL